MMKNILFVITFLLSTLASAQNIPLMPGKWYGDQKLLSVLPSDDGTVLKITANDPNISAQFTSPLDADTLRGKILICSAKIRAEDVIEPNPIHLGVKFMITIVRSNGKVEYFETLAPSLRYGTYSWSDTRLTAHIPDDATKVILSIGLQKTGGTVYYSNIQCEVEEERQKVLPLTDNWKLVINPENEVSCSAIPANAQTVKPVNDLFQLPQSKEKSVAVFYNEFNSLTGGNFPVGMGADWWFECYLNGEMIYSTLETGNEFNYISPANHSFLLPVRQGKNLLAIRVLAGSKGWKFSCRALNALPKNNFYEVKISKEWRPVKMENIDWLKDVREKYKRPVDWPVKLSSTQVKPGTALDLSDLVPNIDIDKNGRVIINKDGKLAFESNPARSVRFYGFNLGTNEWKSKFYALTNEEIENLAKNIRIRGMNLVRLHYLDAALCGRTGDPHAKKPKVFDADKLPQQAADLPIDNAFLDRFDYMVKCFGDQGIYLLIDLADQKSGWSDFTTDPESADSARTRLFYDERYRKNWSAGAGFILNHVNPYTKVKLKDNPQLIGVTLYNEQDIQPGDFKHFSNLWQQNYPMYQSEMSMKLLSGSDQEAKDARKFIRQLHLDMNQFYRSELARMGFRGIITQWDMHRRLLDDDARENIDAVAMHIYTGAPSGSFAPLQSKYQQKNIVYPWIKDQEFRLYSQSTLGISSWMLSGALTRIFGKPFLVTEYSHLPFSRSIHEAGLLTGSVAALQGWDLMTQHADCVAEYFFPLDASGFSSGFSPMVRFNEVIVAAAWLREDVSTARHCVELVKMPETIDSPQFINAIGSSYQPLGLLTGVSTGTANNNSAKQPDLILPLNSFSPTVSSEWLSDVASNASGKDPMPEILQQLRAKNILSPENRTDLNKQILQSETGEILLDGEKQTLTVITPRFEGIIVNGDDMQGKNLSASSSIPATVCALALNKNETLENGRRILLMYGTIAVSDATVFSDEEFRAQIEIGTFPVLIRSGVFSIRLKTSQKNQPKMYALNFDGSREQEIPCTVKNGEFTATFDTSTLQYGTVFFELAY